MNSRFFWISLIILFFLAGAAGSYFFVRTFDPPERHSPSHNGQPQLPEVTDFSVLRIYRPAHDQLLMSEIKIPKRINNTAIAEAVIEEFFRQASSGDSSIPKGVKLLGLYTDAEQMLYIDLSDEVRRNFRGDAVSEYLLLKSLYESLVSNIRDFSDVKILVEGKELESIGGHFYLKYPLKNLVSYQPREDIRLKNE
jgi:hypothetical protein